MNIEKLSGVVMSKVILLGVLLAVAGVEGVKQGEQCTAEGALGEDTSGSEAYLADGQPPVEHPTDTSEADGLTSDFEPNTGPKNGGSKGHDSGNQKNTSFHRHQQPSSGAIPPERDKKRKKEEKKKEKKRRVLLGEGSFGRVYSHGKGLVIKMFTQASKYESGFTELKNIRDVQVCGILAAFAPRLPAGKIADTSYLIMERLVPLDCLCMKPMNWLKYFSPQLMSMLSLMEQHNVHHLDICANNLMYRVNSSSQLQIVMVDWGNPPHCNYTRLSQKRHLACIFQKFLATQIDAGIWPEGSCVRALHFSDRWSVGMLMFYVLLLYHTHPSTAITSHSIWYSACENQFGLPINDFSSPQFWDSYLPFNLGQLLPETTELPQLKKRENIWVVNTDFYLGRSGVEITLKKGVGVAKLISEKYLEVSDEDKPDHTKVCNIIQGCFKLPNSLV